MSDVEKLQMARRVSLTVQEMLFIGGTMTATFPHFPMGKDLGDRLLKIAQETIDPEYQRIAAAYRAAVEVEEGELEIDDDADVNMGDDPGAYVMVWRWVSSDDAGLCRTCSCAYDGAGDGWDGECPDCADKTEAEMHDAKTEDELHGKP